MSSSLCGHIHIRSVDSHAGFLASSCLKRNIAIRETSNNAKKCSGNDLASQQITQGKKQGGKRGNY